MHSTNKRAVHEDPWTEVGDLQESEVTPTTAILRSLSNRFLTPTGRLIFFPLTTVYTKSGSGLWYQISYSPDSQEQTTLRCDVYSTNIRRAGTFLLDSNKKDILERLLKSKIQEHEEAHIRFAKTSHAPGDRIGMSMLDETTRNK